MTVVREGVRLARADVAARDAQHEQAALMGGLPIFLAFFAINALVMAWRMRFVQRGLVTSVDARGGGPAPVRREP